MLEGSRFRDLVTANEEKPSMKRGGCSKSDPKCPRLKGTVTPPSEEDLKGVRQGK